MAERNAIYWQEILYRAHFATSTAMLRTREWVHGAIRAYTDRNVLMLAVGLRGLLEAIADTFDGLADVAPTLAESHIVVRDAVDRKLHAQPYVLPELESDLIHFTYARKNHGADPPPRLHDAHTARECIGALEACVPDVGSLYATLCDYSHPASPTLFRFATEGPDPFLLTFDPNAGSHACRELEQVARRIGQEILPLGVVPCVLNLKTLNAFGIQAVQTPWVDSVDLDSLGVWREFEERLRTPDGPRMASSDEGSRMMRDLLKSYEPLRKRKGST